MEFMSCSLLCLTSMIKHGKEILLDSNLDLPPSTSTMPNWAQHQLEALSSPKSYGVWDSIIQSKAVTNLKCVILDALKELSHIF